MGQQPDAASTTRRIVATATTGTSHSSILESIVWRRYNWDCSITNPYGDVSTHSKEAIWIHLQDQYFLDAHGICHGWWESTRTWCSRSHHYHDSLLSTASPEVVWSQFGIGNIWIVSRSDPKAHCIESLTYCGGFIIPECDSRQCGWGFLQSLANKNHHDDDDDDHYYEAMVPRVRSFFIQLMLRVILGTTHHRDDDRIITTTI